MKTFLFVTPAKSHLDMYQPLLQALEQKLDCVEDMADADVVMILGVWNLKAARLARKARQMDIPYLVCPLGDLLVRPRTHPLLRHQVQRMCCIQSMLKNARQLIATTPLEKQQIEALGWNKNCGLVRYYGFSKLTTEQTMLQELANSEATILAAHEQSKQEKIDALTKDKIVAQIMQIKSRMPHANIPLSYLTDLHTLLYADDYNEDAVCKELATHKLSSFAAAVFEVMTSKTGLTEGFMPLPAHKSRTSKSIEQIVK